MSYKARIWRDFESLIMLRNTYSKLLDAPIEQGVIKSYSSWEGDFSLRRFSNFYKEFDVIGYEIKIVRYWRKPSRWYSVDWG